MVSVRKGMFDLFKSLPDWTAYLHTVWPVNTNEALLRRLTAKGDQACTNERRALMNLAREKRLTVNFLKADTTVRRTPL